MTSLQKVLSLYLLPPSHTSNIISLVKSNRESWRRHRKKICSNYLASYLHLLCTHCHTPSSYKKPGVSNTVWIWSIIFIPTEVPTQFYRVSNITKALKVKQTGGFLSKAKRPQLYKHIIADNVHRKCKTCMGRGQASIQQIFIYNMSSQSRA